MIERRGLYDPDDIVIRIGGIAVIMCDTRQDAVDLAHSLMFPA